MNTPNKLTVIRIILTPIFLFLYTAQFIPYHYIFALVTFIIASITDLLDGKIARKRGLVTNFGKIADPIADKILTITCLIVLMMKGLCSVWVLLIVLMREFTVSALRIQSSIQGVVIPANIFGKIKTASTMGFSILILLLQIILEYTPLEFPRFSLFSNILMWIVAVTTLVSGIIYIVDATKLIKFEL